MKIVLASNNKHKIKEFKDDFGRKEKIIMEKVLKY